MAKCDFNIDFTEPIDMLIKRAKDGITEISGTFDGDTIKGHYSIPVKLGKKIIGTYLVQGNSIAFEITDKPGFVNCERIENELRKYLSSSKSEKQLSFD